MCLIAVSSTRFTELGDSFWHAACLANPDGMGLMFHCGQQLHVHSQNAYDAHSVKASLDALPAGIRAAVHLREATFGPPCAENNHPQVLSKDGFELALMHNGSVPAMNALADEGPSDTALLLRTWVGPRIEAEPAGWTQSALLPELDSFLPERNRLVFLDSHGNWELLREHEGFFVGETWLSNPKARAWL